MAKNIEMNHLNENGEYESIYPKTMAEQVMYDDSKTIVDYVNERIQGVLGVLFKFTVASSSVDYVKPEAIQTFEITTSFDISKVTITFASHKVYAFGDTGTYFGGGTLTGINNYELFKNDSIKITSEEYSASGWGTTYAYEEFTFDGNNIVFTFTDSQSGIVGSHDSFTLQVIAYG